MDKNFFRLGYLKKHWPFIAVFLATFILLVFFNEKEANHVLDDSNPPREYEKYFIETRDKRILPFYLEISDTVSEHMMGLMYRESLPKSHGMLFVFSPPEKVSFWMKNMQISLDIIMIDENNTISEIHRNISPSSTRSIISTKPVKYVLEINGGDSDRYDLRTGDMLQKDIEQD